MTRVFLTNWFTILFVLSAHAQSHIDPSPVSKPAVIVSFERQNIRESDDLLVDIWLSNEADFDLTRVTLHVAAPDFLKWRTLTPAGKRGELLQNQAEPLEFGPVRAHSVYGKRLCISSEPNIKVGDFNLLFIFEYQWELGSAHRLSFVTSEKLLKANLFGSETIAGIPMTLAGFIVPGLFFWLVARWFKVPGSLELPLGDKMIYSVLVSTVFVVAGVWIQALDINSGIGVKKLAFLAGSGIGLGCVVGLVYIGVRKYEASVQAAGQINENDDAFTMLRKLLLQNAKWRKPRVTIQLKDGDKKYAGSLYSKMGEKTVLLGWCRIDTGSVAADKLQKMGSYADAGKLSKLLEVAAGASATVLWDGIVEWKADMLVHTDSPTRTWVTSEIKAVEQEPDAADYAPVRLI